MEIHRISIALEVLSLLFVALSLLPRPWGHHVRVVRRRDDPRMVSAFLAAVGVGCAVASCYFVNHAVGIGVGLTVLDIAFIVIYALAMRSWARQQRQLVYRSVALGFLLSCSVVWLAAVAATRNERQLQVAAGIAIIVTIIAIGGPQLKQQVAFTRRHFR